MGYRKPEVMDNPRLRRIRRVLWVVLLLNLAVALSKLLYGMASGSVAMEADGFHSLFDGTSNVVGLIGMAAAGRPADSQHPYGHGKYEAYASAAIGALLLGAAWKVGSDAVGRFLAQGGAPRVDPGSFLVMSGTLVVNVLVSAYERRAGLDMHSDILLADAAHTASDVVVSLGVVAGLIAVRMGYPLADPILAVGIAGFIAWTAWRVLQRVNSALLDQPRLPAVDVAAVVLELPEVLGCHAVRTRGAASEVCVDLHLQVAPELTVAEGHRIAEQAERTVVAAFSEVTDVIVHLEPFDAYQRTKTARETASGLPPTSGG